MKNYLVTCGNYRISLCKNILGALNSIKVTIIKQFNIKTFCPSKGKNKTKKNPRQFCRDKIAHFMTGENNNLVSTDFTHYSNSQELGIHEGAGAYISTCSPGSIRQVIKIWLPNMIVNLHAAFIHKINFFNSWHVINS